MTQVTATDADDPTYGNSARVVYSILHGQPYFSVDPKTGERTTESMLDYHISTLWFIYVDKFDWPTLETKVCRNIWVYHANKTGSGNSPGSVKHKETQEKKKQKRLCSWKKSSAAQLASAGIFKYRNCSAAMLSVFSSPQHFKLSGELTNRHSHWEQMICVLKTILWFFLFILFFFYILLQGQWVIRVLCS